MTGKAVAVFVFCNITDSEAGAGGGIHLGDEAALVFEDSQVNSCKAALGNGGAAFIAGFSLATIRRSLFSSNTAFFGSGGGISVNNRAEISFQHSTFYVSVHLFKQNLTGAG
jgi:hypothetical protein